MVIAEHLPGNEEDLTCKSMQPLDAAMECPSQFFQTQQQVHSSIYSYERFESLDFK